MQEEDEELFPDGQGPETLDTDAEPQSETTADNSRASPVDDETGPDLSTKPQRRGKTKASTPKLSRLEMKAKLRDEQLMQNDHGPESVDHGAELEEREAQGTPLGERSKREKRRAREAAKKNAPESNATGEEGDGQRPRGQKEVFDYPYFFQRVAQVDVQICNVCKMKFQSRSKLFNHVRETGHALAAPEPGGSATRSETDIPNAGGKRRGKRVVE